MLLVSKELTIYPAPGRPNRAAYLPASQPHDTCANPQQARCAGPNHPPTVRSLAARRDDGGGGRSPSPKRKANATHQHQTPGLKSTNRISLAPWCPPLVPYNRLVTVPSHLRMPLSTSHRRAPGARRETVDARPLARPHPTIAARRDDGERDAWLFQNTSDGVAARLTLDRVLCKRCVR
jgi:hypothetical protein